MQIYKTQRDESRYLNKKNYLFIVIAVLHIINATLLYAHTYYTISRLFLILAMIQTYRLYKKDYTIASANVCHPFAVLVIFLCVIKFNTETSSYIAYRIDVVRFNSMPSAFDIIDVTKMKGYKFAPKRIR